MNGHYIHNLDPFALRIAEAFGLRWYGLAYAAAFVLGYFLYRHLARRGYSELSEERIADFITWAALIGVFLGGRLGFFLLYDIGTLLRDPLAFFQVWRGGMASHGGIAALAVFTWWYARKAGVSWLNIGDNLVTVAPLGLFLGRLANFVNGELYGRPWNGPWAVIFPKAIEQEGSEPVIRTIEEAARLQPDIETLDHAIEAARSNPQIEALFAEAVAARHPSQLYEAFAEGALLFAVLWWARTAWPFHRGKPRLHRPPYGMLTGLFFILYAVARVSCEQFREPDASLILGITRGQFYSLFMILIGVGFIVAALRRSGPESHRLSG